MAVFFVALFISGVAVAQNNDVETNKTSTIPTLTVVEEDFSKWTAGSFDEPDRTELGGKAKGYKIPDELMAQKGWVGASDRWIYRHTRDGIVWYRGAYTSCTSYACW